MNSRERVLAALNGRPVDRVPISFWGHNYVAENSAEGLAHETLRQARLFEWDFLKPQTRAQAFAEMWGLTYEPSHAADQKYTVTSFPLQRADELATLRPVDPTTGALGEQLRALQQIRASLEYDPPIVWTVFSPLMVARYLLPGDATQLLEIARSDPRALMSGLESITETLVGYVRASLRDGADGIFYATNLATRDQLTPDECDRFQRPYDLRVLAAAGGAPFNIMHVCGPHALLDSFVHYPVAAFSWALAPGNPSLADGHRNTGRASIGGVPNKLRGMSASDVRASVKNAVDDMKGQWLLVAADCSIEPGTPDELLMAARSAARER